MDYAEYEACFNTGDDAVLVERFFCDDLVFIGGAREMHGKDALMAFLNWAHDGVREVMRPQLVLRDSDHIFAEIDMDFHAMKERPDFPFGHLHPGDMVTVKFFVTYLTERGKVKQLKAMTWSPDKGVSVLPRLGPHPTQVAAFHSYVAAFSNADCDRFTSFYTPDVVLTLNPQMQPIVGPDGIASFYRPMFQRVREQLTVHALNAGVDSLTLDATTRFTAIKPAPDFMIGALDEGDYIEGRVFVDYTLRDGLIASISVRRNGDMIAHRKQR